MGEFKCRRPSTLVERNVKSSDTPASHRRLRKPRVLVFSQLPWSRSGRGFGRDGALFAGVKGGQIS